MRARPVPESTLVGRLPSRAPGGGSRRGGLVRARDQRARRPRPPGRDGLAPAGPSLGAEAGAVPQALGHERVLGICFRGLPLPWGRRCAPASGALGVEGVSVGRTLRCGPGTWAQNRVSGPSTGASPGGSSAARAFLRFVPRRGGVGSRDGGFQGRGSPSGASGTASYKRSSPEAPGAPAAAEVGPGGPRGRPPRPQVAASAFASRGSRTGSGPLEACHPPGVTCWGSRRDHGVCSWLIVAWCFPRMDRQRVSEKLPRRPLVLHSAPLWRPCPRGSRPG